MKEIPYWEWYRYEHAEYMKRPVLPFIQAQCTLDVSPFRAYAKARGISFYLGLVWLAAKTMEAREDFRWRLRGDKVVLIDSPTPLFTDRMEGTELYKVVDAGPVGNDMAEYAARARAVADAQTFFFPPPEVEARDDIVRFSSLATATFTQLTQPLDTNKDYFVPTVAWSRYWTEGDRTLLPLSIQSNHRLADGLHIAIFFNDLQAAVNGL